MYTEAAGRDVDMVRDDVEEGCVYPFNKFHVVAMKASYKPCFAKYMMKLTPWTKMEHIESATELFPRFVFNLSSFSDLSSRQEVKHILQVSGVILLIILVCDFSAS